MLFATLIDVVASFHAQTLNAAHSQTHAAGGGRMQWGRCKLTRVEDEDGNAMDFTPRSNVRDKMPRRHPPTRFIISRRRVRMVIGRIRKPGEKVSARPQKPRLGRFTQGVSATMSILATDCE